MAARYKLPGYSRFRPRVNSCATSYAKSVEPDAALLGKRKSSTSLDDVGSRKACKGGGSWSRQETVVTEQVYNVKYDPLVRRNDYQTRAVLGYARRMQGHQIKGLGNAAFVRSYGETERLQVKENLDFGTNDDILKELHSGTSFGYGMSTTSTSIVTTEADETGKNNVNSDLWAGTGLGDDPLFKIPLIPDESELLRYSGVMHKLLVFNNYGLEDFGSATSNDYVAAFELIDFCPPAPETGILQLEEMLAGTRDYVTRRDLDEAERRLLRRTNKPDETGFANGVCLMIRC